MSCIVVGTGNAIVNKRVRVVTLCSLHATGKKGKKKKKQVDKLMCNFSSARKETNKRLKSKLKGGKNITSIGW